MEQEHNPYSPPTSNIDFEGNPNLQPIEMVGSGRRFINFLIYNTICYLLGMIFGIVVIVLFKQPGIVHLQSGCTANIYSLLISMSYYSLFEYKFGFTIGKLATKTRVVTESGNKISFPQALGRSFSRLVPFEPFSCFGKESRGWHDSWSHTLVIKRQSA